MSQSSPRIDAGPGHAGPPASRPPARTARIRLVADRAARWSVTAGGLTIIASILGILLFIVVEVMPLFGGASVEERASLAIRGDAPAGLLVDEYRTYAAALADDGVIRVRRLDDGSLVEERAALELEDGAAVPLVAVHADTSASTLAGATADGRVVVVPVSWPVGYENDRRIVGVRIHEPVVLHPLGDRAGPPPEVTALHALIDDAGTARAVVALDDGRLIAVSHDVADDGAEALEVRHDAAAPRLDTVRTDAVGSNVYGGAADGSLLWWRIEPGGLVPGAVDETDETAGVRALTTLIGDRSLVVGRADGALEIWFGVRQEDESFRLRRIRELDGERGAIVALAPSGRRRTFLAADERGGLGLYFSTSARELWTGESPVGTPSAVSFSPRGDAAALGAAGRVVTLAIDNPHPEVSWRALFAPVWYEGYGEPDTVWQSSGGSDSFEPKLSMTPLMVGTLKGTLYSLLLAVPLGVLGAMYASLFMHPSLKRIVKPTVELMAALPSVVLGFLAGLWLAPRVERVIPALALMLVVLPIVVVVTGLLWRRVPASFRGRFPFGSETALYMLVLAAAIAACLAVNDAISRTLFGGSFQRALFEATGLPYDQRNAVVVGLAMGFAVIPIIFSIAEDAFSNVPRNLVSGSLALGANAWQTAIRVVLPTASPGIFSAIMIGFGRAVGETMIVLMATGNTPLMDWNPFNGFRTLSANIAVEIPEAPFGGTLYRTLFLAGLILFVFTFAINTGAELVRQRLRKRYSQL